MTFKDLQKWATIPWLKKIYFEANTYEQRAVALGCLLAMRFRVARDQADAIAGAVEQVCRQEMFRAGLWSVCLRLLERTATFLIEALELYQGRRRPANLDVEPSPAGAGRRGVV